MNTTAGHAVAYPLSTRHGLAHGLANALIFPHTLAANAPADWEKTRTVCQALGLSGGTAEEIRAGAHGFCESPGLRMELRSYGVRKEELPAMSAEASGIRRLLDWNPVDLTPDDITDLYRVAW